jgi:hypothetical protein
MEFLWFFVDFYSFGESQDINQLIHGQKGQVVTSRLPCETTTPEAGALQKPIR